jgi:four helix bundle protein
MANYHNLDVWKDGCEFALKIYQISNGINDFGLKNQMTRSAVSIASNIAEGSERDSDLDFVRFLRIAKGSCAECRTQMKIANMIGFIDQHAFNEMDAFAESINNRISGLIKYLKRK